MTLWEKLKMKIIDYAPHIEEDEKDKMVELQALCSLLEEMREEVEGELRAIREELEEFKESFNTEIDALSKELAMVREEANEYKPPPVIGGPVV